MYEVPPCPACYLGDHPNHFIVCVVCKKQKLPMPDGLWEGDWWYCSAACRKTPKPKGEWCRPHRENLEKLKVEHPDLFRKQSSQ